RRMAPLPLQTSEPDELQVSNGVHGHPGRVTRSTPRPARRCRWLWSVRLAFARLIERRGSQGHDRVDGHADAGDWVLPADLPVLVVVRDAASFGGVDVDHGQQAGVV